MNQVNSGNPRNRGAKQLTLRALVLGAMGSALLTASSMYVALRMGALPWPTVFAAIVSMTVLKLLGNTTLHEINITQTAMTAGSMIAGGLAFTLPGLWAGGPVAFEAMFPKILLIALAGLILGLVLTWIWRPMLLEQEKLPFPVGIATAETIKAGDAGGLKGWLLGGSLVLTGIVTMIRDWFGRLPQVLAFSSLASYNIQAGILLWPMAPAIGYMIGTLYTAVLLAGALAAYFLIIPLGVSAHVFADAAAAETFKNMLGLGLMVGSGLGVLLRFLYERLKRPQAVAFYNMAQIRQGKKPDSFRITVVLFLAALGSCWAAGLGLAAGALAVAGTVLTTLMACLITGQTGIDPMEIFGIIVMMGVGFLVRTDGQTALMIAAVVAVASGFAGDTMFDYKTGQVIGTDPKAQLISQAIGGLLGAVVAAATIFVVIGQFGPIFGEGLPAPQSAMVYSMVNHAFDPRVFWSGAALGILLVLLKVPSMTLGIGMYLPFSFSSAIFIGGAIRWAVGKYFPSQTDNGLVVASGVFGGESLTGVAIAFLSFFSSI